MTIDIGDSAALIFQVTAEDTALAVGSGDVAVLGTPRLVAWCEAATVDAVATNLDPADTSVGTHVRLDHSRATAVGDTVRVRAVVTDVDGRRIRFEVDAADSDGSVGRGVVERVIVNRERFAARVRGDGS